ncbi:uncharacterized protein LOC21391900 [Morus notabilis]|uniref:uncharacterized protein LOC21391900 n=1 Tax=Morus notabilis TaxID=981085 RepID=UPI000CED7487|nr:uncharacterized protein LOC21391900 [Morus notabilis]
MQTSSKQRRSGYEPSDTETDFHESPWRDLNPHNRKLDFEEPGLDFDLPRNISPLKTNRRHSSRFEHVDSSPKKNSSDISARRRHSSKSPYKPKRSEDGNNLYNGNISPLPKPHMRTYHSPYKEEPNLDNSEFVYSYRRQNDRSLVQHQFVEVGMASRKPNYTMSKRSVTAPRLRPKDKNREEKYDKVSKPERTHSPTAQKLRDQAPQPKVGPSSGEINERVAYARLARDRVRIGPAIYESTDSISPGDIFFSREGTVLALPKNGGLESHFSPKPKILSERDSSSQLRSRANSKIDPSKESSSVGLSQTGTTISSSGSKLGSGRFSTETSKLSDTSTRTTESMRKFTENRRKSQKETWFNCMKKGPCGSAKKSPERTARITTLNEALFIEKARVAENLKQFWADKYQPGSLNGFTCHKQEAQLLKQLVSDDICPHILLKGPTGSGKRALAMALLREIYGDASWDENQRMQVVVPIKSSPHHLELNVHLESNARYALMGLVREITKDFTNIPEISTANLNPNYKVIVLYDVDKAADNIQHLIKWILDCYTDACRLILCCEDDSEIVESVKDQCKVIDVNAPITHEIMEVLIQIARKEGFDLSMEFAAKIAIKSKQNLRKAIMALEACKAHNYPFVEDQPIPLGWEEVLVEMAAEILANPSPNTLFLIRGRLQKLLVDYVHPKLILQKLVEQFLKGIEASIKRQLYYWHAYYDKRLPTGPSALLKLEEFVAKFMSIYRKSLNNIRQLIM